MTGLEEPEVDRDLLHHMRLITETLVHDSAWSELLAGTSTKAGEAVSQVLQRPSLQMSIWWAETWPIALGVSSKKPWQAIPTLSNLFETTIWHKTLVVQIIDHSDVFPPMVQIILCPGLQQALRPHMPPT